MKFVFDERRATEAAARVLRMAGGSMRYIDLLKVLYLADRRSLIETGETITGDEMWAMHQGPVLSLLYDQIKAGGAGKPILGGAIAKKDRYWVELKREPAEVGPLSRYEKDLLRQVFDELGGDHARIMDAVHRLPEWNDPGEGKSQRIDPVTILKASGKSKSEIQGLVSEADYYYEIGRRALG